MTNKLQDKVFATIEGHVLITDIETGRVLLDKHNAINFINMAVAIAALLGGEQDLDNGQSYAISQIAYGNGGSIIDSTGNVQYKSPNVNTPNGELYNETYRKSVADVDYLNKIDVERFDGQVFSDVVITSTLDFAEPADQETIDNSSNYNDQYVFDELGLVTESGKFLTHIVFHPIEKSANRKIQVVYTLRIRAGS
jgi:hypothetical protein